MMVMMRMVMMRIVSVGIEVVVSVEVVGNGVEVVEGRFGKQMRI